MTTIAAQVLNNHIGITFGASISHSQFNLCKVLTIKNLLQSIELLSHLCLYFTNHRIVGIEATTPLKGLIEMVDNVKLPFNEKEKEEINKLALELQEYSSGDKR